MERPVYQSAAAVLVKTEATVDRICETHRQPTYERKKAHDSSRLLVMVSEPALPLLVQGLLAEGLVIMMKWFVLSCHPVDAKLALLCKLYSSKLQCHILGQVVRVDVGCTIEGLLSEARVLLRKCNTMPGEPL